MRVPLPPVLQALHVISVFKFCQWDRWQMVSQCSNIHYPNYNEFAFISILSKISIFPVCHFGCGLRAHQFVVSFQSTSVCKAGNSTSQPQQWTAVFFTQPSWKIICQNELFSPLTQQPSPENLFYRNNLNYRKKPICTKMFNTALFIIEEFL